MGRHRVKHKRRRLSLLTQPAGPSSGMPGALGAAGGGGCTALLLALTGRLGGLLPGGPAIGPGRPPDGDRPGGNALVGRLLAPGGAGAEGGGG